MRTQDLGRPGDDPRPFGPEPEGPDDEDAIELTSPDNAGEGADGGDEGEITPSEVTRRVIEAVLQWRVTAVGNRPQDHLARDLLHGSLLRDRRPRLYHGNVRQPPGWVLGAVEHLPPEVQKQAVEHVALHFLHRWHLARVCPRLLGPGGASEGMEADRVWRCWPYGVEVRWDGPGRRTPKDVCGLARLCPWCHGRKALALHRRIEQGPLAGVTGGHLVLARATIWSESMGDRIGSGRFWQNPGGPGPHWYLQENVLLPPNFNRVLFPEYVRYVREEVAGDLVRQATGFGVRGGLVAYQVGPHLTDEGLRQFRHELALLGELPADGGGGTRCLETELGQRCGPQGSLRLVTFEDGREKCLTRFRWYMLPAGVNGALRFLLAGTSLNYPLHELGLVACQEDWEVELRYGIDGALALQPAFMFDPIQWWSYEGQTRGMQLYSPFGTWRCALGGQERKGPGPTEHLGLARRARLKGRRALRQANAGRKHEAEQRRAGLLARARPLWGQLRSQPKSAGRPALRGPLRELLLAEGVEASARDLRWLVQKLLLEEEGKG